MPRCQCFGQFVHVVGEDVGIVETAADAAAGAAAVEVGAAMRVDSALCAAVLGDEAWC